MLRPLGGCAPLIRTWHSLIFIRRSDLLSCSVCDGDGSSSHFCSHGKLTHTVLHSMIPDRYLLAPPMDGNERNYARYGGRSKRVRQSIEWGIKLCWFVGWPGEERFAPISAVVLALYTAILYVQYSLLPPQNFPLADLFEAPPPGIFPQQFSR